MKAYHFLLVALIISIVGCTEREPQSINSKSTINSLNELAMNLAQDQKWMTNDVITKLGRSAVPLKDIADIDINLVESLNKNYSEGQLEVTMELFWLKSESFFKNTSGNTPYRVALDPDDFYFPNNVEEEDLSELPTVQLPCYYFDGVSSEPIMETVAFGPGIDFQEPFFFLQFNEPEPDPGFLKSSAQSGIYLGFSSVTLRKKNDESNDEFEMYFSDGAHPIDAPFQSLAAWQFNGATRADAASVSRYFPDVNNLATYTQDSIALRRIDGPSAPYLWRLVAIDDDNTNGKHIRYENVINGYNDKQIDYYDMADNYIKASVTSRFYIWQSYPVDNDDRYTRSGITNINLSNLNARLGEYTYKDTDDNSSGTPLGDLNWKIRKITY